MSDIHILETDLDLKQNLNIYTTCKQLDTLHLKLNIFDDGLEATLTNYNVRLKALKSDKVPLIQETGITINNNVVTITGDEQLTTASGNTLVELQFINKTTGEKKSTFNLVLKVISTILEVDRTISKATYTLLQELENKLDQASDFLGNIDEAIKSNNNLVATNATANATKTNLDGSISTATDTKTALDTLNTNAIESKKALDTSKTNADNSKAALDESKVNADTSKVALDKSIEDSNKFVAEHADVNNLITTVASHSTQLSENMQDIEKNTNKLTTYDNRNNIGNLDYSLCRIKSGLDITIKGSAFNLATGKYILNNIEKTTKGKLNIYNAQVTFTIGSSMKDPFIIEEDGIYYMFYTFASSGDISFATSTDLITWTNVGMIVNHSNCWGNGSLPAWAPWVSKKQSDGYYYMYICGAQSYVSGYLRSTSLTSGWEWQDKVKDSTGTNIVAIDPSIYEENGIFYMVLANQSDMGLDLYSSNSLSSNSWTYVKRILSLEKNWEGGLIEAGQIIKLNNNEYSLVYGGSSSTSNQRIGLATSNKIDGDYIRRGRDGMILLPIPQGYGNSLAHPHLMYIESKKEYYLFACISDSNSIFHIIGYKSKDLSGFEPINKSTAIPSGNSMLYISPNNDLVISSKIPYDNGNDAYFIDGRIGCILLGTLTNDNGTLNFVKFRLYETITSITAKKETDQLTYTTPTNLYGYLTAKMPTYDMRRNSGKLVAKIIINIKNTATTVNAKVLSDGIDVPGLSITVSGAHTAMTTYTSSWIDYTNYVAYVNTVLISAYCDGTGNFILSDDSSITFAIEY